MSLTLRGEWCDNLRALSGAINGASGWRGLLTGAREIAAACASLWESPLFPIWRDS